MARWQTTTPFMIGLALLLSGCAITSIPESLEQVRTDETVASNLAIQQHLSFEDDHLVACFRIRPIGTNALLLRAPLGYGPGGQIQLNLAEEGPLPQGPVGPAPDDDDFLTFDILPVGSARETCTSVPLSRLPDATFPIRSVFQPWTRIDSPVPTRLSFVQGLAAPDLYFEDIATDACDVDPVSKMISCD